MEFWASAEVYEPAFSALDKVRRMVGPFLNAAFLKSSLATLHCKFCFIPIVMPTGMRERYPARSKLRKKERVCDCAPQLSFDIFVDGKIEDQLREYLSGIASSAPHLAGLGASLQQIADFEAILAQAAEFILVERPDQTRH